MSKKASLFFFLFVVLFFVSSCVNTSRFIEDLPDLKKYNATFPLVERRSPSLITSDANYIIKNKYNQWELYASGNPLELGYVEGALMDTLIDFQEDAFFYEMKRLIPSEKEQKKLLKFITYFNRKLYKYIPEEYKVEIYGVSRYLSDKHDDIAPPYVRSLSLHAAHDIGHALVDLGMIKIGCSSVALWGDNTSDGKLLIGRNLDFYLNKKFANNLLISFIRPDEGHSFVSISWPGFVGVISGMNTEGLTLTMNAGKSKMPLKTKEPISLVARKIIQYASTIEEAIEIAKNSNVFVSESLLIGSAKDNKAVTIEISPHAIGVYEAPNNRLICTNHFQSDTYANDKRNRERIQNGHSMYRYKKLEELTAGNTTVNPTKMAAILRERKGLNNKHIGMGNEKAINQLLCHHAVIFKPEEKQIWISSQPYNLGAFTAYDLDEIFNTDSSIQYESMHIDSLTIPADNFLKTETFKNYERYRNINFKIQQKIQIEDWKIDTTLLQTYQQLNPELWSVYYNSGLFYFHQKRYNRAIKLFNIALSKEITTSPERKKVENLVQKSIANSQ